MVRVFFIYFFSLFIPYSVCGDLCNPLGRRVIVSIRIRKPEADLPTRVIYNMSTYTFSRALSFIGRRARFSAIILIFAELFKSSRINRGTNNKYVYDIISTQRNAGFLDVCLCSDIVPVTRPDIIKLF